MENKQELIHNRNLIEQNDVENTQLPTNYLDDEQLEILKFLCQNLNPYEELSLEEKLKLQEFGITDLSNPFSITNKLLFLLEDNLQFRAQSTQNDT